MHEPGIAANSNLPPEQRGEILDTHLPHTLQVLRTLREIKAQGCSRQAAVWHAALSGLIAVLESNALPLSDKKRAFEALWRSWH